jgi:hypothetical protein
VLGHIFGVVVQHRTLRAVMSFEPASPNTHACSIGGTIGAHVQGGLDAGALTALFIIDHETRLEGEVIDVVLLSRLRSERFAHVVFDALREHAPHDAHDFIGERDDRLVLASSRDERLDP